MPALTCIKFVNQKEEAHTFSYKMHIVILESFHFYLFNFSYKSDEVALHNSHCSV